MLNREHNAVTQVRTSSILRSRTAVLAAAAMFALVAAGGLMIVLSGAGSEVTAVDVVSEAVTTEPLPLDAPGEERMVAGELASSSVSAAGMEAVAPSAPELSPSTSGRSAEEMAVYVAGLSDDWLYASAEDFESSMRSVFAPEHHDELRTMVVTKGVGLMRTALATAPTQEVTWYFTQPLSAAVIEETHVTSLVQVWEVSVFSREGVAEPTSSWTLHDVELAKTAGEWLVSDWQSKPGPVPHTHRRSEPLSAEVLTAKLFDHHRVDRPDFALSVANGWGFGDG